MKKKRFICVILVFLMVVSVSGCASKSQEPNLDNIKNVCELATLMCEYHNVAKLPEQTIIFNLGKEKVWIEYDGYIKLGVDLSQIEMSRKGRKITIKIPEAQVLSADYNPDSVSYYYRKEFVKRLVNEEEEKDAIWAAQNEMIKETKENAQLLLEAQERAKELIEYYIKQIGEATGKRYKIIWE